MRVLLIEDDENLRIAVSGSLRGAGLAVDTAADLPAADEALAVNAYDCAVFDRMLPSGDSLHYLRRRRAEGFALPVLFLTALDSVAHRVDGLTHGDDYLVKPFAMEELVARVLSLCRWGGAAVTPPVLRCGDLELDAGRHEVRRAGVLLTLTRTQFTVLELLVSRQGTPVSRTELIEQGWDEMANPASNVLDVLIAQLRRKLHTPPMLHTVRGFGYRVDPA
ncbi:response regulator transcription factor [Amycolatopsis sp. H20-H5]|uniref:response regulator transcription factor n=1 Tax=Amycolatopsis sp. H20-H5 TaxID=3046309 RepID=UPI002DBDC911|nr:response regulator transcription factor [Amycolatopsis sp. H20-H5]MEC3979287.1 response regulator transcription factor [Amycolatopsis sp. H20-H5]